MAWNVAELYWLNVPEERFGLGRVIRKDIDGGEIGESILRERILTHARGDEVKVAEYVKGLNGKKGSVYSWSI